MRDIALDPRISIPVLAAWLALGACGPSVPHPPYSPQAPEALIPIDFDPPPGRVEQVPPRPHGADAWVDGEWIRRRGRWYWLVGRWVATPRGWTYSPWVIVRAVDGTVFYAPSMWKDSSGTAMHAPEPLAFATASGAAIYSPEGEVEATGRDLQTAPAPPIAPPASALAAAPAGPPDAGAPSDTNDKARGESTGSDSGPSPIERDASRRE
jgi:hypothetical protein